MLALLNPAITPFTLKQETAQTSSKTTRNGKKNNIHNENMSPSLSSAASLNSNATVTSISTSLSTSTTLKNTRPSFPSCLHFMLSQADSEGYTDIASWQPHGRAFRIHKHKEFMEDVMPGMFRQSKWSSFQRQLNLYRFNRITTGPDKGAYYHESFLRGNAELAAVILRIRVKGTKVRRSSRPEQDPDFYDMPSAEELLKAGRKNEITKNMSNEETNDHRASDDDSSMSASAEEQESKVVKSPTKTVQQKLEPIPLSHVVSLPPSRESPPKDCPAEQPILPKKKLRKTSSSKNVYCSTSRPKVQQQNLSFTTIVSTPQPLSNLINVVEPESSVSSSSSMNDIVDDEEFRDLLKGVFGRSSSCDITKNFVPTGTNTVTMVPSLSACEELLLESTPSLHQQQQEGDVTMLSYDTEWGDVLDSVFD